MLVVYGDLTRIKGWSFYSECFFQWQRKSSEWLIVFAFGTVAPSLLILWKVFLARFIPTRERLQVSNASFDHFCVQCSFWKNISRVFRRDENSQQSCSYQNIFHETSRMLSYYVCVTQALCKCGKGPILSPVETKESSSVSLWYTTQNKIQNIILILRNFKFKRRILFASRLKTTTFVMKRGVEY